MLFLFFFICVGLSQAAPFDLPDQRFAVETVTQDFAADVTETVIKFPSSVHSPWPANNMVWVHLLVPTSVQGRRAPAVLVLPVLAAPNIWIETQFMRRFVRDGFIVMWVEMPTQFHRRPDPSQPSGEVFLARHPQRLRENFRQAVLDSRRALGVLMMRPEVDTSRVALFGISLGAIVGAALYAVDHRACYAIFLLGGADIPSLVFNGSLTGPIIHKMGLELKDLRRLWLGLDCLERKAENRDKPAYLINARSDTVVPRANAEALAEAFPSARQDWLPGGHYSAIIHLLWLPRRLSNRLKGVFQTSLGPGKKTIKGAF